MNNKLIKPAVEFTPMQPTDDQQALERALKEQQHKEDPLQQVKAIRKEQLDRCAIKRNEEIDAMLKQAQHGED